MGGQVGDGRGKTGKVSSLVVDTVGLTCLCNTHEGMSTLGAWSGSGYYSSPRARRWDKIIGEELGPHCSGLRGPLFFSWGHSLLPFNEAIFSSSRSLRQSSSWVRTLAWMEFVFRCPLSHLTAAHFLLGGVGSRILGACVLFPVGGRASLPFWSLGGRTGRETKQDVESPREWTNGLATTY